MSHTILDKIVDSKHEEVEERKGLYPAKLLEKSVFFSGRCASLKKYLQREDLVGIIAEIKRQSPSKGVFKKHLSAQTLALQYMQSGASALSVLTDKPFFGGANEDLVAARRFNFCPILRKDFIVDPYQIVEAKAIGADAILLIAKILNKEQLKTFAQAALDLGMEVLIEITSEKELELALVAPDALIGVNNRNLADFTVDIELSLRLAPMIPAGRLKVSESGIGNASTIKKLKEVGFSGFLIGETFMSTPNPAATCAKLVREVKMEDSSGQRK